MKTVSRSFLWVLTAVGGMSLGAGAMVWSEPKPPAIKAPLKTPTDLSISFREAARHVLPSVVTVMAKTKGTMQAVSNDEGDDGAQGIPNDELFRQFFGDRAPRGMIPRGGGRRGIPPQMGTGSGVIVDSSGVILTNAHVVNHADEVTIELQNGHRIRAKSWATDPRRDVAVVKIETKEDLPAAELGDSDEMQIGDWVLALGNPFNVGTSVTQGIISATGRSTGINELESYIQTDAAVNPGNSGGPLINLNGQVIGINTAISTNSGGYDGVSFAIPISMVRGIADQLVKTGTVKRSYLGIGLQPMNQDLRDYYGVPDGGVLVTLVNKDTPASKAGLQNGDIILELAGKKITSGPSLTNLVDGLPIGQSQPLLVLRKGAKTQLTVVPEQMPEGYTDALKSVMKPSTTAAAAEEKHEAKLGISVRGITPEVAKSMSIGDDVKGVVVVSVTLGGSAQDAGISRGDIITKVNGQEVTSKDDFGEALKAGDAKKGHLFEVLANGKSLQVVVHPTE